MRSDKFVERLEEFREKQIERVRELKLDDINVSLYEAKALGFSEPEEMIKWHIYAKMSMSSRHLKGRYLEDLVRTIAEGIVDESKFDNQADWDIAIERNGKIYLLDIKYALNPINLRNIGKKKKEREFQSRLGKEVVRALGTPRRVEGSREKVKNSFEGEEIFTGDRFWEFIADEEDALSKITEVLFETNRSGENLNEIIEEQSRELAEEWKLRYGDEIINDETVERFF